MKLKPKGAERFRLTLPLVLLLASIGIVLVAAFQAQEAVRQNHRQAEETLRDYTSFAAWSFRQHLKDALFATAASVLGPVNHGRGLHEGSDVPPAIVLAHMLPWDSAGCFCHRMEYPARYFLGYTLGADTIAVVPNLYRGEHGVIVDTAAVIRHWQSEEIPDVAPYSAAERRWVIDTLSAAVRHQFAVDWQYGIVVGEFQGRPRVFAYRPMARSAGDTIVYAVELAPRTVMELFGSIIDQEDLLPPALTRNHLNRDLIAVRVLDRRGQLVYRSDPDADRIEAYRDDHVPDAWGGFTVRAAIKPRVANMLVIGGLPRSRLPLLIGLLLVAATLSVVAVQQLRRAAALTRTRADFVAAVSHELRTPLSQIRLYLDTLRLGRLSTDKERAWSLDHLDREATRLNHLVENVLRFASVGQERVAPLRTTAVAEEVRQTLAAFEPLARSRRASVVMDIDASIRVPLMTDAFRVALLNLLDNAVKYGPSGQTVRVEGVLDGDVLQLSVADEGPGIAAADRDVIWKPFERGSSDAARSVGGSGIGLSIVSDIMARHGGSASLATSTHGARFVLRFPGAGRERAASHAPDAQA